MKLETLTNQVSSLISHSGDIVYFSGNTPVAATVNGVNYRVEYFYEDKSNKFLSKIFQYDECVIKPQDFFHDLLKIEIKQVLQEV